MLKNNTQFLACTCYSYDLIQLYFLATIKMNKVIVLHNAEEKLIMKVWRFHADNLEAYNLKKVKAEALEFFPLIKKKRLEIFFHIMTHWLERLR